MWSAMLRTVYAERKVASRWFPSVEQHAAKECLWEIEAVAGGYEEGPWRVLAWSWGASPGRAD